jgi:hypothetical protein
MPVSPPSPPATFLTCTPSTRGLNSDHDAAVLNGLTRLIMALGVAWILDGQEITLASPVGGMLAQANTVHLPALVSTNAGAGFPSCVASVGRMRPGGRCLDVYHAHRPARARLRLVVSPGSV